MTWLKSRRLQYLLAITALFFSLMVVLRAVFYFGFSPLSGDSDIATDTILTAWGIGLRFDLRLALLLMLPLAALAYLPWLNLLRSSIARFVGHAYLLLALLLVVLTYILDFGHYAYLGDRLNVTALRFLEDTAISTQMVWESYPVIWITLGWLLTTALTFWAALWIEKTLLGRPQTRIAKSQATFGFFVCFALFFFAILGRVSDINILNPIPLRWSEAFATGNKAVGSLGLNPVLYLSLIHI